MYFITHRLCETKIIQKHDDYNPMIPFSLSYNMIFILGIDRVENSKFIWDIKNAVNGRNKYIAIIALIRFFQHILIHFSMKLVT